HVLRDQARHRAGVLAERADIDDRVRRVVVDVGIGGEIDVDADGPALDACGRADRIGIVRIAGGADRHDLRKGGRPHHAHTGAPLEIGRHEERQSGSLLQRVELGGDVERGADGDDQPADLERVHPPGGYLEERIVQGGVASREPRNDELPDLLADREAGEQRLDRNHRDGGRRTGHESGCPSDCLTAGTPQRGGNDQELMRPHSLSLLVVIACAVPPPTPAAAQVRPGIEVLLSDSLDVVAGRRVALLTNQTGVDRLRRRVIDFLSVPMRHGMTMGELVRFANDVNGIHARLTVVPALGWRRAMFYDDTGLPWVRPSPNLPDLESVLHYPGTCLFEGTNLSVGRGTAFAFQVIGAPWLDTAAVLSRLRVWGPWAQGALTGVEVSGVVFTPRGPTDGKYDDVEVRGIRFHV